MNNIIFDLVKLPFVFITRRIFGTLRVNVQNARVVGEVSKPGLAIKVTVENPQDQNGFVNAFEVVMLEPFKDSAVENAYEFRVSGAEANVEELPINIPAYGISKALVVIAHFNNDMSSSNRHYRARIAAIGREGFRKRYTEFDGECPW